MFHVKTWLARRPNHAHRRANQSTRYFTTILPKNSAGGGGASAAAGGGGDDGSEFVNSEGDQKRPSIVLLRDGHVPIAARQTAPASDKQVTEFDELRGACS